MRIDTLSPKLFLMLKLSYTKKWCWALKLEWFSHMSYYDGIVD